MTARPYSFGVAKLHYNTPTHTSEEDYGLRCFSKHCSKTYHHDLHTDGARLLEDFTGADQRFPKTYHHVLHADGARLWLRRAHVLGKEDTHRQHVLRCFVQIVHTRAKHCV